jgi:hypothetical protein
MRTLSLSTLMIASWVSVAQAEEPAVQQSAPVNAGPWHLSLHLDTVWRSDGGYRAFSTDGRDQAVGLTLLHQLRQSGRFVVEAGAGWQHEQAEATGGFGRASFEVDAARVLLLVRHQTRPWLSPHLRLGAGVSHGSVDFTMADGSGYDGGRWAPSGEAGVGLSLRTPTFSLRARGDGPWVAVTLTVEGGVQLGTSMHFDLRGRGGYQESDAIATRAVPAGDLARNHPYLRTGVGLGF